jgi:ribosomal protein S12 methylthiotransferase
VNRPYIVQVVSLGCAKNFVDTEVICGGLAADGVLLSPNREDADLVLVNTCGFIEDARREADQEIRSALKWKRQKRGRAVMVAGCLPRRLRDQAEKLYPDVDLFLGLDDVGRAAELVRALRNRTTDGRNLPPDHLPTYLYDHTAPRLALTPPSYGYIKIGEGCDHRCAYCIIPDIRGRQRSRSIDSVVEECRQLLDQGRLELDLIAQDTTRYGLDREDGANLAKLIQAIDKLPGDFLVRILYTHPLYLTDEIIAAADMADQVPRAVAEARRDALLAQQQGQSLVRNQALVGKRLRVLVDAAEGRREFLGRTLQDAPETDNLVHLRGPRDCLERGFVDVLIEQAEAYDLHGKVLE